MVVQKRSVIRMIVTNYTKIRILIISHPSRRDLAKEDRRRLYIFINSSEPWKAYRLDS